MLFDTPSIRSQGTGTQGRGRPHATDLRPLMDVERYWRSIGENGQPPKRADVDPTRLGEALSQTMILERVAPGMARIRLSGQGLNDVFGMDVRGMPASVLVAPQNREALGAQIEAMFAGPAIVEIPLKLPRSWGRRAITARLLLLPLTDQFGQVTRALGVIAAQEELPSGGQHRFEVDDQGAFRCTLIAKAQRPHQQRRRTDDPAPRRMQTTSGFQEAITPKRTPASPIRVIAEQTRTPFSVIAGGVSGPVTPKAELRPDLTLVICND